MTDTPNATLFTLSDTQPEFPKTRYLGSKRRLTSFIVSQARRFQAHTVLDAFSGTACVAYAFKLAGHAVTCNDLLAFNQTIAEALVANDDARLDKPTISTISHKRQGGIYTDFIERTFNGVYFTADENRWLDIVQANIRIIDCDRRRALAWFALFQSCMAKRPYNLFHRRNLYMRQADCPRSFGNKASWDRSFDDHFAQFAAQANRAVISTGVACRALRGDALQVDGDFDLVYLDPPYMTRAGVGVPYRDYYHFLEGLLDYDRWPELLDTSSAHRRLAPVDDPWCKPNRIAGQFADLFDRFRRSVLMVSYRSDGIPSIDDLVKLLSDVKRRVRIIDAREGPYALSTRRATKEVLLIGDN